MQSLDSQELVHIITDRVDFGTELSKIYLVHENINVKRTRFEISFFAPFYPCWISVILVRFSLNKACCTT